MGDQKSELSMPNRATARARKPEPSAAEKTKTRPLALEELRRVRRRRLKRTLVVGASAAILLAGFSTAVFKAAVPVAPAAAETRASVTLPPVGPKEVERIHAASRVMESKFPRPETSSMVALPRNDAQERERVLKSLEVDGRQPRFFPVGELTLPKDGKPLRCYCLLSTPLDLTTEEAWDKAGMLRHENVVISPYLRYVTVDNEEALQRLGNAFVSGVTYSLSPEPQ